MDREGLAGYYGFGSIPEELHTEIISMANGEAQIEPVLEKLKERMGKRNFYLFVNCDIREFGERQLPFSRFVEMKYGIKGELLYEPTLGVAHYMSRRGMFLISEQDMPAAICAMLEFPYHFYAIISDKVPEREGIDRLISETRGMALLPHIAKKCLEYVVSTGAEFVHAVKKSDETALSFFYK